MSETASAEAAFITGTDLITDGEHARRLTLTRQGR
jgi:hypothetical protein